MINAGLTAARETRNDGAVTLSRTLSRRSTVSVSFTHTSSRSAGPGDGRQPARLGPAGTPVSPSGVFHAGYGFGSTSIATAEAAAGIRHDVDFGFDFSQAAPVFRPNGARDGNRIDDPQRRPQPQASCSSCARASRAISRARWSTRIEYTRPMQFVAGFQQPFLSDALGLNVDGQLGRAWFLSIAGGCRPRHRSGSRPAPRSTTGTRRRRACAGRSRERGASKLEGYSTRFRFTGSEPVGADASIAARAAGRARRIVVVGCVVPEEIEVSVLPGRKYAIEDFLRIAWRRKWLILLPFVVVSVATVLVVRRLPDVYRSETTILVIPQRVPDSYVRATVTDRIGDRLQSLNQQILSRSSLEKIIVELNLFQNERSTTSMEDLIARMRNTVKVDPVRGGCVQGQLTSSPDPVTAQVVTERLATLFIQMNVEDRGSLAQGTSVFLKERLVEQEQRLIEQEKKLEAYRLAHAGELPSQAASNVQGLQSARAQLQTLVDSMNRERERLGTKERELGDLLVPEPAGAVPPAGVSSPSGGSSTPAASPVEELAEARSQLLTMEERLTAEHPDVRRLRRRVAQLEAQVQVLKSQRPAAPATAAVPAPAQTPNELQRERRIRDLRAEIDAINQRIGALQRDQQRILQEINVYQARLEAVPVRESEQVELMRDYETVQTLYRDLLSKHEAAKIAEAMEKGRVGEQFRVLDPALIPDRPYSPDRLKLNALGIAFGLLIGLGIVAALEFMDSTLKSEEDIRTVLALPVIATIPVFSPKLPRGQRVRGVLTGSGTALVILAIEIARGLR